MKNQHIINRNEVEYPPAPACLKILRNFKPNHASHYIDDYYQSVLIPKLANLWQVQESQIMLNYGSEDFFRTVFDHVDRKKESVLTHYPCYSYHEKYTKFKNIPLHYFQLKETGEEFIFDIADCLSQYKKVNPSVILITSPNNPTGNSIANTDLATLLKKVQKNCLVVIDEAYCGFDSDYDFAAMQKMLHTHDNLVILRSFSKYHALAGLRISYAVCGNAVKEMLGYQDRYLGFSRILEEVAVAALDSPDYYQKAAALVMHDREQFITEVNSLEHVRAFNSRSNFVLIKMTDSCKMLYEQEIIHQKTVIAKEVDSGFLRVTVGMPKHTTVFLRLLQKIDVKAG